MKMSSRLLMIVFAFALGLLPGLENLASAQDYGRRLGVRRGGEVSFEPRGSGVLFDALDPAIKRWYVPQELYSEYNWKQWEYSNYARHHYQRYVDTALEGDYFYDFYGNFVTKGWLIFHNEQSQPLQQGNQLFKDARFRNWFSGAVIASDAKGQYHYSMTIGDEIAASRSAARPATTVDASALDAATLSTDATDASCCCRLATCCRASASCTSASSCLASACAPAAPLQSIQVQVSIHRR